MAQLNLDVFLSSSSDLELSQYEILHRLKWYYDAFSHNRLYPALTELIDLSATLESLLMEKRGVQGHLPKELKSVDLQKKRLVYEPIRTERLELERVIELITWALPYIKEAIEEGARIFDFVDDHLQVENVGLLPIYREEGYYFVPEPRAELMHLHRYEVSLFTSASERFRTLRLKHLRSKRQALVHESPHSLKLELIDEHADLPNPATFVCEIDIDFPFLETILPIAKRKLLARVYS